MVSSQESEPLPDDAGSVSRYRFADVEFDAVEGQLRVAGRHVVVEPRPLRLLLELLQHVGEVVAKEELLDSVWEGRPTVDHVLANAVSKLRTALGAQGAARLVTVPRVGYRLQGPVQRLTARPPDHTLQAGQPVSGREGYVLERALGQGAHSDVWLARHAKLGQVHVFKFATDGPRLSALKREYTLYRLLAHELGPRDDFARVLDSNFAAAPYFIECEFGGQSLLEWAEQDGRLLALPTAARIGLFLQIGRAVAAAHSVGVLHKDLKPGNVLVAAESGGGAQGAGDVMPWQVRLTDFGSGRLLDAARLDGLQVTALGLTQTQGVGTDADSGTLLYLAPELLAGQPPTVQSEVYALGLMLWQMLAGDLRRPMATGWQRQVNDELLREDLAAATEGRPSDRIKSVAELVDRLARLPARRAARDAAAAQARQAAQAAAELQQSRVRRPWLLGALACLAAGLLASVVFGVQARNALHRAEAQTVRADAINGFMNEDFLSGIDVAGVGPEGTVSLRAVLERAATRAGERFKNQPATEALVRGQLAGVFHMLSMFQRSETEYRHALALASPDALATDPQLLKLRFDLVGNLAVHNKLPEAKTRLADAERDAGTLTAGVTPLGQSATRARLLVLHSGQRFPEALVAAEKLVALVDQHANPAHADDGFTARALLGDTLYRLGQLDRAENVLAGVVVPRADGIGAGSVNLARARVLLARVRVAQGKTAVAEPELVAARDVLIGLLGPDEHYVNVANAELASILDARGDFIASRAAYQTLRDNYQRSLGPQHPSTRVMGLNLAIAELNLGHPQQALQQLDASRGWFVSYAGGEQGAVVQAIDFERARALTGVGRAADAVPVLAQLNPQVVAAAAPARDWPWRLQAERGRALLALGRRAEGLRLLQVALPAMQAQGSAPWVLAAYRQLVAGAGV